MLTVRNAIVVLFCVAVLACGGDDDNRGAASHTVTPGMDATATAIAPATAAPTATATATATTAHSGTCLPRIFIV